MSPFIRSQILGIICWNHVKLSAPEITYLPSCKFAVGRVPDEPQGDMTTSPAGSGENLGLFMLRKDSERRDTLHRILTEYISHVVQNIQETLPQVHSHTTVSPEMLDVECCITTSALSWMPEWLWIEMYVNTCCSFLISQTEEPCITSDHISKLICCLRENIRSPDKRHLSNSLLTLRSSLLNSSVPLSSLQAVLFSLQDAVCSLLLICFHLS